MVTAPKDQLLKRIQSIENDELVAVLDADISFFLGEKDVIDSISTEDQQELLSMVNEPFGFETESADEFIKATERWRTK
jgi:hypothetical protein